MAKAKEQFLEKCLGVLPNFMLPEKNQARKTCIQDKKIEDIRIVNEEYSIDKIIY